FDKDSKKPLANTRIKVVGTDNSSYEIVTDPNGGFNFELNGDERYIKQGTTYSIHVDKADYLVAKDQISTIGMKESKSFIKEFYIQRASSEVPIKLENVVYQGSALVAGNGKTGLDDLIQILRDNPTMNIEIQVHTDQRGNAKDNLELSQKRAEIARIDLVTKGIAKDRVKAKGYGGAQPLNGFSKADIDELPTKEAQEKAHKRNRRTEFTVLNFDHQPN
ncbi:MAG: peptidoglycan-associated lipoprotein, partial [Crocinitomicaceae bacterium]